jgi:cytochrome c oxidase subunit III
MSALSPTVPVQDPRIGGRGGAPPTRDGGGGNGGGSDGYADYRHRLRRARLGIVILMVAIVMLFVAFTSAYVFRQGLPTFDNRTNSYVRDWIPVNLPIQLLLVNTLLLLMSSLTIELARRQMVRRVALAGMGPIPGVSVAGGRGFPWLGATVVLGVGFLVGQWMAWKALADRGFYLATNPSSSFVYLLTAAHAVHLMGGLVVMLYAASTSLLRKPLEARCIVLDVSAWYWHFMAFLWFYIFALLVVMK